MNVREAIAILQKIEGQGGGDLPVVCWPNDGHLLWRSDFESVQISLHHDGEVISGGHPEYRREWMKYVMIDC